MPHNRHMTPSPPARLRGSVSVTRAAAALVTLIALAGCALDGDVGAPQQSPGAPPSDATVVDDLSGTLTVLTAASLSSVFAEVADALEERHPSLDVVLVIGGSSALAQQLIAGAPADLYAAADDETMSTAREVGVVLDPVAFARNSLALAVPAGNPGGVVGLDDLARPELLVALCASEVPCGRAADRLLRDNGVTPAVDTRESDVRAVLTKIAFGEVDAGLVYETDALAAQADVDTVSLDGVETVATTASIALVNPSGTGSGSGSDLDSSAETERRTAAAAFIDLVLSEEGARILRSAGFALVSE